MLEEQGGSGIDLVHTRASEILLALQWSDKTYKRGREGEVMAAAGFT